MSNGIYIHDDNGTRQVSPNPLALESRVITNAVRRALAEEGISIKDANALLNELSWFGQALFGHISGPAMLVMGAMFDGVNEYATNGAPRTVPSVPAPDEPGEQAAF